MNYYETRTLPIEYQDTIQQFHYKTPTSGIVSLSMYIKKIDTINKTVTFECKIPLIFFDNMRRNNEDE